MLKIPEGGVARRIITPQNDGYEYFFGYYDLQSYSADDTRHLFHRTKLSYLDRLPGKDDVAELGYVNLKTGEVTVFAETTAWNFQQGAMLQWNPRDPEHEIIYNTVLDGEYAGVVMDIRTGRKRYLEKPVANVSRDGKWGLSVNFSRLYHFRPGYGYAALPDPFFHENHAREDGIHLIDMETGKAKLIISMEEIWDFSGKWFGSDRKMNINHITFNPDASRFLFLARNFRVDERPHRTALITAQAKRLHLENIRPMTRDASKHREDMDMTMDAVLLDAPCSGLGVMADKPDVKYRITPESVSEIVATQRQLLDAVAPYVKRGGVLVYSTCSVLKEENVRQAEDFLARHPEFELAKLPETIPAEFRQHEDVGLQLLPSRDGVEGFYICKMKRKR